jgi:hypothetical protein
MGKNKKALGAIERLNRNAKRADSRIGLRRRDSAIANRLASTPNLAVVRCCLRQSPSLVSFLNEAAVNVKCFLTGRRRMSGVSA